MFSDAIIDPIVINRTDLFVVSSLLYDYVLIYVKTVLRFVTGLVHAATVGLGDIDRQHIVGADVFQTIDVLNAVRQMDDFCTHTRTLYTESMTVSIERHGEPAYTQPH